jgi:hypothetical protein
LKTDDNRGNELISRVIKSITHDNGFIVRLYIIFATEAGFMVLTRKEKEKFVLDLYDKGKTYREIAQEARISPRDIGVMIKKATEEKEKADILQQCSSNNHQDQERQLSISAQAYKLFSEHKTTVEVAIALDLPEPDITELYREYLKLKRLDRLNLVYEELGEDIVYFLKLYRLAKNQGLGAEEVSNLLTIANSDLPSVEYRYQNLEREVNLLELRKLNLNKTLEKLENQIISSSRFMKSFYLSLEKEKKQIDNLYREKKRLETIVKRFKDKDEEYLKIRQVVEEKVISVLSNGKDLIRVAILSLMESIRNDPYKYSFLFNNRSYIPYAYEQQQPQRHFSKDPDVEAYKDMLVDEAEKLFNSLVKELRNTIMADDLSSFSPSEQKASPRPPTYQTHR